MTAKKVPPFYENFDSTHCVQCVLRGILEYFEPGTMWTWDELDALTGKEPDKWTWPYCGDVNMIKRGYDVVMINASPLQDSIDLGLYGAMVKHLGVDAANKQREMADLDKVALDFQAYVEFLQKGDAKRLERVPTIVDMKAYLDDGYLIACSLNPYVLYDMEGYSSHLVLVYDIDDEHVYFHNSGKRMAQAGDQKTIEKFVASCVSPTPSQWTLTAYKKSSALRP